MKIKVSNGVIFELFNLLKKKKKKKKKKKMMENLCLQDAGRKLVCIRDALEVCREVS